MRARLFEKVETKEFTVKDMEQILSFRDEFKKMESYGFLCEKMFDEVLNEIRTSGSLFGRVAYLEGKPVGFILGDVKPRWYLEPESAWLIAIVVHPNYRRQGIGRRLIAEFFEQVRELGLKKICVIAGLTDEETLCFLQKMGFKRGRFIQFEKQV